MKHYPSVAIALSLILQPLFGAEETTPEIAALQDTATAFVKAYNGHDAAAIAALYTEEGEIYGDEGVVGREAILARYLELFAGDSVPEMALEVESVRLVAPNVAIEDGLYHLALPGEDEIVKSFSYIAVLVKNSEGAWHFASTRTLADVTDAAGNLAGLAADLKGNWTCQNDGVRMDWAFGWDETGTFLSGEALSSSVDSEPLSTSIRIGWDGARRLITWWSFDNRGGFSSGDWAPTADGWIMNNSGSTADGKTSSNSGHLIFEGGDTILWRATDRILDGDALPDLELRIVRQAPEPAIDAE